MVEFNNKTLIIIAAVVIIGGGVMVLALCYHKDWFPFNKKSGSGSDDSSKTK